MHALKILIVRHFPSSNQRSARRFTFSCKGGSSYDGNHGESISLSAMEGGRVVATFVG